ncbi:hypothetical protein D3C87_2073720 [compost metagenome]
MQGIMLAAMALVRESRANGGCDDNCRHIPMVTIWCAGVPAYFSAYRFADLSGWLRATIVVQRLFHP